MLGGRVEAYCEASAWSTAGLGAPIVMLYTKQFSFFRDAELETVCPTSFVQTTPVWSAWEQSACAIGNFLHVLRDPASARALCFALLEVPCGGTHGCVGSRRWRARVMAIRAARGPLAHDRTIEQMAMYVLAGSISSRVARSDALW
jgi:hypothetical protein